MDKQAPSDLGSRYYLLRLLRRTLQFDLPPKADMSTAANAVSSYHFFAGREDRSPSVPIWSEVDTHIHILNKGIAKHRALIDSASSAQTHRKPSVHFRPTDLRS